MMALNLEEWRQFIQTHLPTALVVGFSASGATYVVTERLQEKQIAFLNTQIETLRKDTTSIETLKTKVKDLEGRIELFEEQRKRRDDMLPTIAKFDPKQLFTPSRQVQLVEVASAKN